MKNGSSGHKNVWIWIYCIDLSLTNRSIFGTQNLCHDEPYLYVFGGRGNVGYIEINKEALQIISPSPTMTSFFIVYFGNNARELCEPITRGMQQPGPNPRVITQPSSTALDGLVLF